MSALRLAGAVFDADGTLFDTERLALEVWLGVAREWDAPGLEEHWSWWAATGRASSPSCGR